MVAVLAAWLLVWSAPAGAQTAGAPPVSAALRSHLRSETLTPLATVGALPASVRNALQGLFKEKSLALAEPGAPFQVTDVVIGTPLPFRRLIAAGCSSDHCVVYYERGGIDHSFRIVVFTLDGATARLEYGGLCAGGLANLDAVKDALLKGRVIGQTEFW